MPVHQYERILQEKNDYFSWGPSSEVLLKQLTLTVPDTVATPEKDDLCAGKFTFQESEKR